MPAMNRAYPVRKRILEIIEVGALEDYPSRAYDIINMLSIVVNLLAGILYTYEEIRSVYGPWLVTIEAITVAFFTLDFALRVLTAGVKYEKLSEPRALLHYLCTFNGIVDILSFLPYYLPIFFPSGMTAFRMFRVVRIFRLFRINAYYDSLSVITEVITSKKQQLISSVFIISVLMLASSLCMYSLEHDAQPDVFTNAFSGIWWSVSTLLTVGYGDIYPITTLGKLFSIIITFLGVGMVAIPTGIISAGFVDQYSRIKRLSEYADEEDIHFIKLHITEEDTWNGRTIQAIRFPQDMIVAAIQRNGKIIVPRGSTVLQEGDTLVLGAAPFDHDEHIDLKEVVLLKHSPWNGQMIRDLDISRQTIIILVKRGKKSIIPNGNTVLMEGDKIIMYTQMHVSHAHLIHI